MASDQPTSGKKHHERAICLVFRSELLKLLLPKIHTVFEECENLLLSICWWILEMPELCVFRACD